MLKDLAKKICSDNNIFPTKYRGQNFLVGESYYAKILDIAKLQTEDIVLEVGPGLGFLTEKLAGFVRKVIAIELDHKMVPILKARLQEKNILNVEIIESDILKIDVCKLKYDRIVANLPYNISSVFLRRFLEDTTTSVPMTLMLQRELAERIVEHEPRMSILSVAVQAFADARIRANVPATAFWPAPRVDSVLIEIIPKKDVCLPRNFFQIVRAGFANKRKMLVSNLCSGLGMNRDVVLANLLELGLNDKIRAQELSVKQWIGLASRFD